MARTASAAARILSDLYDETFKQETCEPFRITWPQLRSIAGVASLDKHFLRRLNSELNESDYFLLPLDNSLLVTREADLSHIRAVPDRIVEEHVYDATEDEDIELDDDDDDDIEVTDFEEEEPEQENPDEV